VSVVGRLDGPAEEVDRWFKKGHENIDSGCYSVKTRRRVDRQFCDSVTGAFGSETSASVGGPKARANEFGSRWPSAPDTCAFDMPSRFPIEVPKRFSTREHPRGILDRRFPLWEYRM